jgi:hypothetical protein
LGESATSSFITNATLPKWAQLEIEAFLSHLAQEANVSASTQNQAFNALFSVSKCFAD